MPGEPVGRGEVISSPSGIGTTRSVAGHSPPANFRVLGGLSLATGVDRPVASIGATTSPLQVMDSLMHWFVTAASASSSISAPPASPGMCVSPDAQPVRSAITT